MTDALVLPLVFVPPFQWRVLRWIAEHQAWAFKGAQIWLILIVAFLVLWILKGYRRDK